MIYLLVGAGASGKDTLAKELVDKYGYKKVVGNTTRPMRAGEINGYDYNFRSEIPDLKSCISLKKYETANGDWYYWFDDSIIANAYSIDKYIAIVDPNGVVDVIEALGGFKSNIVKRKVKVVYLKVPLSERLSRYYKREKMNEKPNYEEVIRRCLADETAFEHFMADMWTKYEFHVDTVYNLSKLSVNEVTLEFLNTCDPGKTWIGGEV